MNSFRRRRKISHLKPKPYFNWHKASLPMLLLLRKCGKHPKCARAVFAAALCSWVGLVALLLARIPPGDLHRKLSFAKSPRSSSSSPVRPGAGRASPLRAGARWGRRKPRAHHRKERRNNNDELKKELRRHPVRDGIAALLLPKVLPPDPRRSDDPLSFLSLIESRRKKRKNLHQRETDEMMESKLRSTTRAALDDSEPYPQASRRGRSFPWSKHENLSDEAVYAFAAEEYLDRTTRMGDDDDKLDYYYAVDDDRVRGNREEEEYEDREEFCATPSFYRLYRPTCNDVHASAGGYGWLFGDGDDRRRSRYLGAGAYRQVFLLERGFASDSEQVIFKSMKRFPQGGKRKFKERAAYNPDEVYKNFELYDDMRKDSMVMELLTSSPRIADIYSFCALSSLIEYVPGILEDYVMPTGGYEVDNDEEEEDADSTPVNDNIDPLEKLQMALELAKGLATMHGYSGGVIANVDVQIGQFSRGKNGLIKILDFNRAEVLMWDGKKERYCTFSNGVPPDGSLRAPEEIIDAPLTEKIDVYTAGNLFYSILTGLLVNRNRNVQKAHQRLTHGKTEYIDVGFFESRSPAEMALVKVIQWCWTFDAKERPSIFQVMEYLEDEVRKNVYTSEDIY